MPVANAAASKDEAGALIRHLVERIEAATVSGDPFHHIVIDDVFPADIYRRILALMPTAHDYRALPGRGKVNIRDDGSSTRVKIDLFPEYVRHLPPEHRALWSMVGRALRSDAVRDAFVRQLAPALKRRFGDDFEKVGMYPVPMLTRDTSGYRIPEHTDTQWKGITVQLYLPPDDSISHVGTGFDTKGDSGFRRVKQMQFKPNHGYAFAVGDDSWHSVDPCEALPISRDSILHTYFVDQGVLRVLRNRSKRVGNFIQNEVRHAF
jgi:hypothetical protein